MMHDTWIQLHGFQDEVSILPKSRSAPSEDIAMMKRSEHHLFVVPELFGDVLDHGGDVAEWSFGQRRQPLQNEVLVTSQLWSCRLQSLQVLPHSPGDYLAVAANFQGAALKSFASECTIVPNGHTAATASAFWKQAAATLVIIATISFVLVVVFEVIIIISSIDPTSLISWLHGHKRKRGEEEKPKLKRKCLYTHKEESGQEGRNIGRKKETRT
mmetsp:Transcript_99337/g.206931  ORF Transcript_99337/g.206931 Transcript_99337/m.206931 type:complete len:214 (-) Transcript_99337:11-652(-)